MAFLSSNWGLCSRGVGLTVTLCSGDTDTLGYAGVWDAGPRGWHCYARPSGDAGSRGDCYTAMLGPRGDVGPRGDTAMLGLEETLDLGVTATLLHWGLEETLNLGVTLLLWASSRRWSSGVTLLHCYAGASRRCWTLGWHCYTAMLGLEETLDLKVTLLHCYAGPRLDAGPLGDTATLGGFEETMDLEETLVPLGLVWTLVSLGSEETMNLRRRWWRWAQDEMMDLEETMDLKEILMPLGLVWTLVPLGSEETMALGRHWWRWDWEDNGPQGDAGLEETLPAGAGAGLLKAILGARTPVAPRTSHSLWSGCWSEECLEQLPIYREIRAAFSIWWSRIQLHHWSISIQVNKGAPVCLDVVHTFSGGNPVA